MELKAGSITGLAVLGVGLLLLLIGFGSPDWSKHSQEKVFHIQFSAGLWEYCGTVNDHRSCSEFQTVKDGLLAVRAFAIVALVAGIVAGSNAAGAIALGCLKKKGPWSLYCLCGTAGLVCLATCILAVTIYARDDDIGAKKAGSTFGFAFYLTIIGGVFIAVGSIVIISRR